MNAKLKERIEKIYNEYIVFFKILILTLVASAIFFFPFSSHTDFECSVHEYYQGNYSKALEEINNSDDNSIRKYYIRGLINYKLNKYQEALKDLNIVAQNIKSIDTTSDMYFIENKKMFKNDWIEITSESMIEAFIKTHQIISECKFHLKDYRGAVIDYRIALDTLAKYQKNFNGDWVNITFSSLCYYNAVSSYKLKNYNEALYSFNEIIKLKTVNSFPKTYLYKGLIEIQNKNKDNACLDFSRAGELGCKEAYSLIKKHCKN
jgi:tetratricopeptide (TPR) repeat protein